MKIYIYSNRPISPDTIDKVVFKKITPPQQFENCYVSATPTKDYLFCNEINVSEVNEISSGNPLVDYVQKIEPINKSTIQYFYRSPERSKPQQSNEFIEHCPMFKGKVSIIIPYLYLLERVDLFRACITNLSNTTKHEIIVAELGVKRKAPIKLLKKLGVCYVFKKHDGIFNRSLAMNLGAEVASGDKFIFMDGDLIIERNELKKLCEFDCEVGVGWDRFYYLTKSATETYLNTKVLKPEYTDIKTPKILGAAGGITVFNADTFRQIGGYDINFEHVGEDNAMLLKCKSLVGRICQYNTKAYHLYHDLSKARQDCAVDYGKMLRLMKEWNKKQWLKYVKEVG